MSSGYVPPPPPPASAPYGYVPPPQSSGIPGLQPRKRRTGIIVASIVGAIVLAGVLFVGGIFALVFTAIKSSDAYKHGIEVATHDPRVGNALGTPIAEGWFVSGNINVSGSSGNADLAIPVAGSHAKGTLYVVAKKSAGQWTYQTLELKVDGQEARIDLLPAENSGSEAPGSENK